MPSQYSSIYANKEKLHLKKVKFKKYIDFTTTTNNITQNNIKTNNKLKNSNIEIKVASDNNNNNSVSDSKINNHEIQVNK